MNIERTDTALLREIRDELLGQAASILESNTFPINDESTLDEESRIWWLGVHLQASKVDKLRKKLHALIAANKSGASA